MGWWRPDLHSQSVYYSTCWEWDSKINCSDKQDLFNEDIVWPPSLYQEMKAERESTLWERSCFTGHRGENKRQPPVIFHLPRRHRFPHAPANSNVFPLSDPITDGLGPSGQPFCVTALLSGTAYVCSTGLRSVRPALRSPVDKHGHSSGSCGVTD